MAVVRVEKTRDYTVMANHYLRNKSLSLKAKGLMSLMLSLPDNWDYTIQGLAVICKDGIESISSAIKELEAAGYVIRQRVRNDKGQLARMEYIILEQPQAVTLCVKSDTSIQENPRQENPRQENPRQENPRQENPRQEKQEQEKPTLENSAESNTNKLNTNISNTEESNLILSASYETQDAEYDQRRKRYQKLVYTNIEYDYLIRDPHIDRERLDELVSVMIDTICMDRKSMFIAGRKRSAEDIRKQYLLLDSSHIQYVLECMKENVSDIKNIKKYMQTALYNAPLTIKTYYTAQVNHDMYGTCL